MGDRIQIDENALNNVVGGKVTYTWGNGKGTCGLNGKNTYKFDSLEKFEAFVGAHPELRNGYLLDAMVSAGIIYK
jgi:hypothetical protein